MMRTAAAWAASKVAKPPGVSLLLRGSKEEQPAITTQAKTTRGKRCFMMQLSRRLQEAGLSRINKSS